MCSHSVEIRPTKPSRSDRDNAGYTRTTMGMAMVSMDAGVVILDV